jgi:hypothetical protein
VVAEEKTSWLAPFGKQYAAITVLLLVVMALGYAGIVYGGASQAFLFLSLTRGYSAGFVFALTAWSSVVSSIVYLLNAFVGDRFERRAVQLASAIFSAGGRGGVLIAGQLFVVLAPRNFILFITVPCALVPGVLLAIFGKNQRRRALEEMAR